MKVMNKIDLSLRGKPFLLAPLPFVLIVIYGALFANWPNESEKKVLSVFTDIVLFNTLHGYFTLAMIFCLPAAGVWFKERDAAGRRCSGWLRRSWPASSGLHPVVPTAARRQPGA